MVKIKSNQAKEKKISNPPISNGTGRRKAAVARVWLRKGEGKIIVNGRDYNDYFTVPTAVATGKESFETFKYLTANLNATINLNGGGFSSQANAVRLGIARALLKLDESLKPKLRKLGFLTVDSRGKERKKPGQRGARAKFQFTKR